MADSSPPIMSGGSNTQLPVVQTQNSADDKLKDAVEMKPLESNPAHGSSADKPGPSTSAKDTATPDAAGSTTSLSAIAKGKQREAGAPGTEPARDSLQIDRTDDEPLVAGPSSPDGPVCNITLLLPTGARHPYRIDAKYLEKRNVEIHDLTEDGKKDPFSISVYKLKELILREWRDEWENRPASPSSIRLIHFGKLLDDKEQLKRYQFSAESPNVVHMSVKPAEMMEEEEGAKSKAGGGHGGSGGSRSGCCVIL